MQKITLTTETRRCINPNTFLGYEGENNANKLVFEFTDGFLDGLAVLKVERGETKGTIDLVKVNETYELEVKSSLLAVQGDIKFQFVITEPDGTITKYDPFVMTVKDAIDADGELPEEYPSWQEIIATELAKVEKATENANKVAEELLLAKENGEFNGENGISPEAKIERISNGVNITITDANGTTAAEVYDGKGTEVEVPTKTSQLENDSGFATEDELNNKVDKVAGKSLIADTEIDRLKDVTNYDDTETKQDIADINQELNNKADKTDIPDISGKQDTLVSGTNIKTINGESILGDGNIVIEGGSGDGSIVASSNPIGTIIPFMGTTPPEDYLICDGTVLNISDYPDLASHFEKHFGSKNHFGGDGTTTFAIPDLRNEFLRGYGELSGEIGEHQNATVIPRIIPSSGSLLMFTTASRDVSYPDTEVTDENVAVKFTGVNQGWGSGDKIAYTSKPTNVAVLFCIKYTESGNGSSSVNKQVLFEGEYTTTGSLSEANLLSDSVFNYDIIYLTTYQKNNGSTFRLNTITIDVSTLRTATSNIPLWTSSVYYANYGYYMAGNFGDGTQLCISESVLGSGVLSREHGVCKVVGIKY